jgi:hypothetical protein
VIRAILHDPVTFPEPFKFSTERFLDPLISSVSAWANWRRQPFIARLVMANMLATFEVPSSRATEQKFIPSFISES